MEIALLIFLALILCFSFVIFFGAPYLPTLKPQVEEMIKLSGLREGDRFLELGCGDGRVLVAAAKKGIYSVGYEINPLLYLLCLIRAIKYRKYIKVVLGDFWHKEWPEADVIFVFLLERYMNKLDKKCIQYEYKPLKLVSFAFKIPDKTVITEKKGLFLYKYS